MHLVSHSKIHRLEDNYICQSETMYLVASVKWLVGWGGLAVHIGVNQTKQRY